MFTTDEDTAGRGMLCAHDVDRESAHVAFRIVSEPAHGSVRRVDASTGELAFDSESSDGSAGLLHLRRLLRPGNLGAGGAGGAPAKRPAAGDLALK